MHSFRRPARFCGPALLIALCLAASGAGAEKGDELARASRLAAEGKRKEALELAARAVARSPRSVPAQRLYQDLMLAAGKRAALLAGYRRARKKTPKLRGLIRYLEARAEESAAERRKKLEVLLGASPRHFWASYDLVAACAALGDLEAAAKHGRAARDLRPRDPDVRNVLAGVYLRAGKAKEAEAELAEALKLRPRFAQAHYNLGLLRAAGGKYQEAAALFRKAGEEDPGFAEASNNLGHCLARLKKSDGALAAYRKAIALKPDYAAAYNNLAVELYRRKDYWDAWKNLMLAEKHGHPVAPSFKRVLEKKLFPRKEKKPGEAKKPAVAPGARGGRQ